MDLLRNREIAELLARAAETAERGSDKAKALRRASRRALLWPVEIGQLRKQQRSLTELSGVGPWLDQDVEVPEPPPLRRGFQTITEARVRVQSVGSLPIHGDLQMHTVHSDGLVSTVEMAEAAVQIGHSYIAVTDHGVGLRVAGGMSAESFVAQWEEIDRIHEGGLLSDPAFRILKSAEANLDTHGAPDMEPAILASCDIVLGAFHSQLRRTEEQTSRYMAAIRGGSIDVLAHPRGRIYNFRLGLVARWEEVAREAARRQVALETDAYIDRQDLDMALLRVAAEQGAFVSIGSDAHHHIDLPSIDVGIAAVMGAGVPPERVLNCMTADRLMDWVREGRRLRRSVR